MHSTIILLQHHHKEIKMFVISISLDNAHNLYLHNTSFTSCTMLYQLISLLNNIVA